MDGGSTTWREVRRLIAGQGAISLYSDYSTNCIPDQAFTYTFNAHLVESPSCPGPRKAGRKCFLVSLELQDWAVDRWMDVWPVFVYVVCGADQETIKANLLDDDKREKLAIAHSRKAAADLDKGWHFLC